jgi:hypothetical protein
MYFGTSKGAPPLALHRHHALDSDRQQEALYIHIHIYIYIYI